MANGKKQKWNNGTYTYEDENFKDISIIINESDTNQFKIINQPEVKPDIVRPKNTGRQVSTFTQHGYPPSTDKANTRWPMVYQCPSPRCHGEVDASGFCDTCGKYDQLFSGY